VTLRDRFSFLREVWREFSRHNGLLLAAAVSFYAFLSLFPLLLVVVGVLGYVLRSPVHAEALLTHTLGGLVVGPQVMSMVQDVIHGRNAAAGIGLLLLLWSGMAAAVVLEQAMNVAWNSTERRGYMKGRAVALLALVVVGVLMSLSFGVTALLQSVRASSPEYLYRLTRVWGLLGHLIAATASVALFATMYKLLPYARVTWRTALVGGLFAGALWEAAKQIFTFYVVHWAAYSRVYGSLASVILLMVWINYSAVIAILGAEFASHWSAKHETGRSA
jgi:membrane protein